MEQTWRWFGPRDAVSLADARQASATGIVTALHDIPPGEVWPVEAIQERQRIVEAAGMTWSVVESVNVSEEIKKRGSNWQLHIDNYVATLRNLAQCGIQTVCYNFMPVLDWLRTDIEWQLPDGSISMRFEADAIAAFDLFILQRPGAEADWSEEQQRSAHARLQQMGETERDRLVRTVLAGLPGTTEVYTLDYVPQRNRQLCRDRPRRPARQSRRVSPRRVPTRRRTRSQAMHPSRRSPAIPPRPAAHRQHA